MFDVNDVLAMIKKAAVEAVAASKPAAVTYGLVTAVEPLEITVGQKLKLSEAQLQLTRNVTDYQVEMTVEHETEGALHELDMSHTHIVKHNKETESGTVVEEIISETDGDTYLGHVHDYVGKKDFTVHNHLLAGEEVVLIQIQGGQRYLVLDRVKR